MQLNKIHFIFVWFSVSHNLVHCSSMIVLLLTLFCAKNVHVIVFGSWWLLTGHLDDLPVILFVFVGLWVLFLITNTLDHLPCVFFFFVEVHRCDGC